MSRSRSASGGGKGVFLWKCSVILYLVANGILGLSNDKERSDFWYIFNEMFQGDALNLILTIASVISLVAGLAVLLDMFKVKLPFFYSLIFIVAMIWVVYVIIEFILMLRDGFGGGTEVWWKFQMLATHLLVMSSLLIASKKFG